MIEKVAVFCKNMLDWFKSDRCFVKHFMEAFPLTNDLLLFTLLILSVFFVLMYAGVATQLGVNVLITMLVVTLLGFAVVSGFFYYIKINVEKKNNQDDTCDTGLKNIMSIFYSGVGKHYLSFVGITILYIFFAALLIYGTYFIAGCPIKDLGVDVLSFFITMFAHLSPSDEIIQHLNNVQKHGVRVWMLAFALSCAVFNFLTMLWIPEILLKKKNIVVALFSSMQKLFKNFLNALCVYLTIIFINNLPALLPVLFGRSNFIAFILLICSLYLLIYKFYVIFLFHVDIDKEN